MARKTQESPSNETDTQPKTRRTRTAKVVESEAPATTEKVMKPTRTRKKNVEIEVAEPVPEAKAKARSAKKTSSKADSKTDAIAQDEPAKRAPRKRQAAASAEPVIDEASTIVSVWRAKSASGVKATAKPTAEKDKTAQKPERKRTRRKSDLILVDHENRLSLVEWRPAGTAVKNKSAEESVSDDGDVSLDSESPPSSAEPEFRARKFRDRKSSGRSAREQEKEAPAKPPVLLPEPPVREPVAIPDSAPQVVLHNGKPVLIRDRTVIPPLAFFSSTLTEGKVTMAMEEAKMAAENGVHLFSFLVELEVSPESVAEAIEFATYVTKKFLEVDPEGLVILRTVFIAPNGWDTKYPTARYISHGGGLAEPSLCDDPFWEEAEACLVDFVAGMKAGPVADRVLGIHLERGEWFFAQGWGYDTSQAAHEKFREWLRHRYRNDVVTLRASWFDGSVQFETVPVPEYSANTSTHDEFVRTDRKSRRWVDYHLFLSDSTSDRISKLAYSVKKASHGTFIAGVSYGYTFEWSHPASGHLALGKLLRSPDLDYIAGPPSYRNREPGGSAAMPSPIDSFALNGKLYISEEDYKTPISGQFEPDDFNPVMKTPQALESVHWRGAGTSLAHDSGVCWMDSWGNGWLNSGGIWQRANAIRNSMCRSVSTPKTVPDVAVFIDERSLAYLVDERAFEVLVQNVREAVLRSGLKVGFFLLSDLAHRENFPESKLYVFANAWDIRPEVRSAIKSRLQRDNKVLFWLYAAGLFEGGRESLERVREVTGIALRPQPFNSKPGTSILNHRDPLCQNLPEHALSLGGQLEPSYFAIPEDARILGDYTQTGLPSFVVRHFEGEEGPDSRWTSVFLGEPIVTPGLFRALANMAGAHVWSFSDDLIHVGEPFVTVHCQGSGIRTVTLPDKWTAYHVTDGEWAAVEGNSIRFHALDGSTHTFIVGLRSDVEAILAADPETPITVSGDLQRTENTLHWDMVKFDVPIMKLDEWVEETWSDEHADDFLLKPSQLEIDHEESFDEDEPRSRGRRRRRRREGGREESTYGRREGADREASGPDVINVMFRKRE